MLFLLIPIYFYLHIYLSSVIPDSYGVNESCCFCLRKKRPVGHEIEDDLADTDLRASIIQDSDEENGDQILPEENLNSKLLKVDNINIKRNEDKKRMTEGRKEFSSEDPIQLKNMTMKFGDFLAVDKLTLSIKKDEIIALLGHNGAGKTTAIYMLTGMLMPSGGDAIIHGNSIKCETDLVRRSLGLC